MHPPLSAFIGGFIVLGLAAQSPPPAPTLVDQGYRQMYNLEFEEAHKTFHQWEQQNPNDPIGPVSDAAAYLFSEFERLNILQSEFFVDDQEFVSRKKPEPDPALKRQFLAALDRGTQLADRVLAQDPQNADAMFAILLANGLRSDYLALIEKKYFASLSLMKQGRVQAQKLLAFQPSYYDAYLAIGLENYMLSLKAAPVRWFLQLGGAETDKAKGLEKLRLTAANGRYLKPFARLLLAVAAARDKNYEVARELLTGLAREFPKNRLYAKELTHFH